MLVDDRATSSVRSGKSYKYKVKGFDSFCWRWEGQLDDMAPFQNCAPSRICLRLLVGNWQGSLQSREHFLPLVLCQLGKTSKKSAKKCDRLMEGVRRILKRLQRRPEGDSIVCFANKWWIWSMSREEASGQLIQSQHQLSSSSSSTAPHTHEVISIICGCYQTFRL